MRVGKTREQVVMLSCGRQAADNATRASDIIVVTHVAGGRWERRAGVRDVIAWAADDAVRAGSGNVIARVADKAIRESGEQWHEARTREGSG